MKTAIKIFIASLICMTINSNAQSGAHPDPEKIDSYKPRFGRTQPVVAVVALNEGTELTDFIIPYGVLGRSGTSKVVSVSVKAGAVNMAPLSFSLQNTITEFDKQYPQGADYIIVPAVRNDKDQDLVNWIKSQGEKGGTVVSVCLGAMVVANTGLMDGHRATSYFPNLEQRKKLYPEVYWEKNIRYVSDGKIVSSAGISASIPLSIALVEAIGGHQKALAVAKDLGVKEWTSKHNSDIFMDGEGPRFSRSGNGTKESTGIPVKPGDDEIAIGLAADAFSMTGKTTIQILADSKEPVTLANGLRIIPNGLIGTEGLTRVLPQVSGFQSIQVIDRTLDDIAKRYGKEFAYSVARAMEYPEFTKYKTAK